MLSCTAYCSNFVKSKLMFSVSTQEEAVEEEEEEEDDEEEDEEPAKVSIYYQLPYGRCTEPFAQFKNLALSLLIKSFYWALKLSACVQAPQQKKPKVDASAANGSSTVFVKNLPWSADEDTIAEFFADCGTVANVRIGEHPNKWSGCSRSMYWCAGRSQASVIPVLKRSMLCLQVWTVRQGSPGDLHMFNLRASRALQQPLARMALSSWVAIFSSTLLRRGPRAEQPLGDSREEVSLLAACGNVSGR